MGKSTSFRALAAIALPTMIQAQVPTLAGYTLTWGDDFTGPRGSAPSAADWTVMTGTAYPGGAANWGTNEIETYTSNAANVQLSGNGQLELTAVRDAAGAWTSGKIETTGAAFGAAAGGVMRIEASISLPNLTVADGLGYWPAFWTLGSTFRGNYTNWPMCGELDIMENVNAVNQVWGTMHCDTYFDGECKETDGLGGSTIPTGTPVQGNFHKYTLEVDRSADVEAVRWFFDDALYWQLTSNDLTAEVWAQTVHTEYFILLNLAIGGAMPNNKSKLTTPTDATASTGTMTVEYVAVYNKV